MAKRWATRGIIKDVAIVAVGIIIIWFSLQAAFGTQNPFYVVASRSMVPELSVYDVLVVQARVPFEEVKVGDVIVFDRPSDHNRVIVHRVVAIIDDEPKTLMAKGDANAASIPGTDYPITEKEYIGSVVYVIPQAGYVTQVLKPPVNYIIIAIIIAVMIVKQMMKKKEPEVPEPPKDDKTSHYTFDELLDSYKKKDTKHLGHAESKKHGDDSSGHAESNGTSKSKDS